MKNWLKLFYLLAICPAAWPNDVTLADYLRENLSTEHHFVDEFDAQVFIVSKQTPISRFIEDRPTQVSLLTDIHAAATAINLDVDLVLALIEVESGFNRFAISSAGAQGLMQVMPFWKNEIGRPEDNLTDVKTNLRYGCYILKYYIERHPNSLTRALAAYNGSLGKTWYAKRIYTALDRWQ